MSIRNLRNPNALPAQPSPEQLRDSLVDIWSLVSPHTDSVSASHTTSGAVALETLICTNSIAITVTLHGKPADGDEVVVKRQNAQVTIAGNGQTIDGAATLVLSAQYDAPHLHYTESGSEWSII